MVGKIASCQARRFLRWVDEGERTTKKLAKLLAVLVGLMCVHVGGYSAGTFAAFLAMVALLAQVRRFQVNKNPPVDNNAGGNLREEADVSPVEGGSDSGLGEFSCRLSRKDGSVSRKDGSPSQKEGSPSQTKGSTSQNNGFSHTDGPLLQKDGSPPRQGGSSKVHTDDSLHAGKQEQGALTTGVPPPPIALTNRGVAFEGAITRLAGAAELGTESLIYIRRADVAEIIDALVDHARASAASGVTSPALARLSIMRRSRRREGRGKRRDGRGSRLFCSPEVRAVEGARAPSIRHSLSSSHSPVCSSVLRATVPTRAVLTEGSVPAVVAVAATAIVPNSQPGTPNARPLSAPAATAMSPNSQPGTLNARPLSQASTVKVDDGAATVRRARSGGRGGEQGRWRSRTRSPPPRASLTPATMVQKAPQSAAASTTVEVPRTEIKRGPSPACGATGGKITRVPIRPVAAGKGADFEDFWSSGWG